MPSRIPLRYRLGQLAIEATESDTVTGSVIPVEEKVPACRRTEEEKNHHEGHEEEASFITLSFVLFVPFVVPFLRSFPLLSSRRRPGCEAGPLGFCGNFRRSRFARQKVAAPFCPTAQGVFTRCTSSRTIPTCTDPLSSPSQNPRTGEDVRGFRFSRQRAPDGGGRPEAIVPDGGGRPEAIVSIASPVPHTGTWTYGRASLKGCPGPRQREPQACFSGEALPVARL